MTIDNFLNVFWLCHIQYEVDVVKKNMLIWECLEYSYM